MQLTRLSNNPPRLRNLAAAALLGGLGLLGVGCDVPSFLDPAELATRQRAREPLVVQVLDELDPALESANKEFATAGPPRAEDLLTEATDYVVGPNDLLQITVYDLEGPGLQTIKNTRVSGTGNVTLPYLNNVVRAEGLSEIELQQTIKEAYQAGGVLENANVSVSVVEARNRAYSVMGSISRPGQYVITDEDFRVLDALTAAGDVQNPFIEDLYVYRRTDNPGARRAGGMTGATSGPTTRPARGGTPTPPADELAPPQSKAGRLPLLQNGKAMKKSVLLQAAGSDPLAPGAAADTAAAPVEDDPTARVGRVDGQEVVVQPGADTGAAPAPGASPMTTDDNGMTTNAPNAGPFEFEELPPAENIRVIRIPLAKLRGGDLRYNIAVRPRDVIFIPPGLVGFYYMNGHVGGIGAYAFSGQKVTLKNAIAGARGLDGLAIPQRTDIIRKIGPNQEMFYRVDLAKIFAGQAPDVYLKPDDQVLVGTNFLAPFLAAVRGGFRLTYGFGFLYDRNFASEENNRGFGQ